MLKVIARPHRHQLAARHREPQKLFLMLKVIPSPEVATARPPLALCLVVDTSRSMRLFVDQDAAMRAAWSGDGGEAVQDDGGNFQALDSDMPTLLDQAIEACHTLIDDARLLPTDQVAVVHFDDDARTLHKLSPLHEKASAHAALELMKSFVGGTHLAKGLELALFEMQRVAPTVAKRVFVLTDGVATDERACRKLLPKFAASNAPIVAIGFGPEYKEKLMTEVADSTSGRPYHLQNMSDLMREVLEVEIGQTAREVVTDLQLEIKTAQGVRLDKISRAHPSLGEVSVGENPIRLGNIAAGDFTVFILEFTVEGLERQPSRARLAQLKLRGSTHAGSAPRDLPEQDVIVEFADGVTASTPLDGEVIGYVQQKNVGRMIDDAMQQAARDPQHAQKTLQAAASMTQNLGNAALSGMIDEAAIELSQTGSISSQTAKTVALGTRTRTVKTSAVDNASTAGSLSADEIRRLSGT
jgi:Ca-activated chloride channel family protein